MAISPITDCPTLLREMVAFDTVTPHVSGRRDAELPLAEYLASVGAAWGFDVDWLPVADCAPNLLLTHRASADYPWRLFDSHLDTVGIEGMAIDPLGGEITDGRLFGRGACDTKGTGAAMLWAARQAIEADSLRVNPALLFSVGEEHCQLGAQAFIEDHLPSLDWRPDGVVVGEPTRMQAVGASNGFVRSRVTTHGVAAHSSTPQLGHNAITDMARAILAIESDHIARLSASHPLTGQASCSINGVHGGVQHNIVPDLCEIQIDQRLTPGETAEDALASVRAALAPLIGSQPRFRYELGGVESAPPMDSDVSLRFAERVAAAMTSLVTPCEVIGAPFTTNANHYAAAGLPSVVIGPGDIAQAHTKDEWISLEQLDLGVRVYQALMERQDL